MKSPGEKRLLPLFDYIIFLSLRSQIVKEILSFFTISSKSLNIFSKYVGLSCFALFLKCRLLGQSLSSAKLRVCFIILSVCLRVCLLVAWTNRPPVVQKRNPVRLVKCLRRWRLLPLGGRPPLHRRQPLLLPSWAVKPRPGSSGKVTSLPLCSTAPRHELRTNIPRQGRIIKPWLCRTETAKWSSWTVEPASSDTFLLRQFNTATRNKITQCLLESQLVFSGNVYVYWEGAAQVRFQCNDYCMMRS